MPLLFSLALFASACGPSPRGPSAIPEAGDSGKETAPPGREEIDPALFPQGVPAIYRDFGPFVVREGEFQFETPTHPWSAWWLPVRDRWLFAGDGVRPGPLQKYDAYVAARHRVFSRAARYEEDQLYDPGAEGWEGLCHAWALVSVLFPEPTQPVTRAGITFEVADLKALLIKSYEQYVPTYYGASFSEPIGSTWNALQAHLFHRFAESQLGDRGVPFIMNKVPGTEVWNVPVQKFWTQIRRDPDQTGIFHVRTVVVGAAVLDGPSNDTSIHEDAIVYTYDLFTQKDRWGREIAVNSVWTGLSGDAHPSVLIVVPAPSVGHRSRNPELRNEWIEEILGLRGQ